MTPEAQVKAIAQSVGWVPCKISCGDEPFPPYEEVLLDGWKLGELERLYLPDFLNDRNAICEAVYKLNPRQLAGYAKHIQEIINLHCVGIVTDHMSDLTALAILTNCSAKQRCEAYLRAMDLWIEEGK